MLDPQEWPEPPTPEQIRRICDRHLGVGADGILWGPIGRGAPFGVRLFNPDGGEFEKSGNGLRIFARYLWDQRLPAGPDFDIDTPGGRVTAHVLDAAGSRIAMDMGRLSFDSREIGLAGPARTVIEEAVEVDGRQVRITAVTIGNPHCVVFSDGQSADVAADFADPSAELAQSVGPKLEHLPLYPHRTNVQFAQVIDLTHPAHRDLGAWGGLYAGVGHLQLRSRRRGDPHRSLRQPRHRADAGRNDARRSGCRLGGTPDRNRRFCVQWRAGIIVAARFMNYP